MLYPQSKEKWNDERFLHPGSEYRGAPFWAWNCELDEKELLWQIDQLKQMGFGGFHMHVRTGMNTPYLSDEYMAFIRACVEKARQEGMLAYLYDEDRWPSGAAGGLVTKGPEHRMRYLVLTWTPQQEGTPLAAYDIQLNDDGTLGAYSFLDGTPKGFVLYANVHIMADHPWHNNQGYLNVLDAQSVQAFIRTTHDRYAEVVGEDFGGLIPSIFTDEPHFHRKGNLNFAKDTTPLILPWTDDLPETFRKACGLALAGDWPGARESAGKALVHWERCRPFSAVLGNQAAMEEVDSLFARLEICLETESSQTPALCAELARRVADLCWSASWWDLL